MKVRCFGRLRDTVGDLGDVDVPPSVTDSDAFRAWLGKDYPDLLDASVRMALDDQIIIGCHPLGAVREISFLPPMSGG